MESNQPVDVDVEIVSRAMSDWLRYYDVDPDEKALAVLARVAGELFADGYRSPDDLSTCLIGTYIGRWSLMVNAPTSASVH